MEKEKFDELFESQFSDKETEENEATKFQIGDVIMSAREQIKKGEPDKDGNIRMFLNNPEFSDHPLLLAVQEIPQKDQIVISVIEDQPAHPSFPEGGGQFIRYYVANPEKVTINKLTTILPQAQELSEKEEAISKFPSRLNLEKLNVDKSAGNINEVSQKDAKWLSMVLSNARPVEAEPPEAVA
jgi:hypothetical protein